MSLKFPSFQTSAGILSKPHAFLFLIFFKTMFNSSMVKSPFVIGSSFGEILFIVDSSVSVVPPRSVSK